MDNKTEVDINAVITALKEQIGLLALDKAVLTARVGDLERELKEKNDRE